MKRHYQVWRNNSPPIQSTKIKLTKEKFYVCDDMRLILTILVAIICLNNFENILITVGITLSINFLLMLFRKEDGK